MNCTSQVGVNFSELLDPFVNPELTQGGCHDGEDLINCFMEFAYLFRSFKKNTHGIKHHSCRLENLFRCQWLEGSIGSKPGYHAGTLCSYTTKEFQASFKDIQTYVLFVFPRIYDVNIYSRICSRFYLFSYVVYCHWRLSIQAFSGTSQKSLSCFIP